jgi:hypothetical protein
VDVTAFGAKGNGVADDTAAINTAIAAVPAGGGILWFPAGSYRVSGPLTINRSMAIQGVTRFASRIITAGDTAGFVVTTLNAVTFSDLIIQHGASYQTGGAGVTLVGQVINGNLELNRYSSFRHVDFLGQHVAIDIQAGVGISITDSQFADCATGVRINNPAPAADTGDNQIIGNTFASKRTPSGKPGDLEHYAIDHRSGGGVRVIGNKILGYSIGYRLSLLDTVSTADTMIANNSMERQLVRAIQLTKQGTGSGGYSQVTIADNQIAFTTVGIEVLPTVNGQNWLFDVVISGNLFLDITFPIGLLAGNNMLVDGNVFQNGGGSVITAVTVGAAPTVQNVRIGPNAFAPGVTSRLRLGPGSSTSCTPCN